MKTRQDLIRAYIDFFKSKQHKEIPSSSLIPENDPTVLFTTAGMHPLVPYLQGQKHPLGKRLVSVQKCIRTGDIDEVGDTTHHTFFEMLGNWSLGDYWKQEAIEFSFEFLTKKLALPKEKLAVSIFEGDNDAPKDTESEKIWLSLGMPKERIAALPKENNWWGPAGQTGPCGPDTEMFYWTGKGKAPKAFDPKDKAWVEIWNDVFMEYEKTSEGKYIPLKQRNVDTGMGVERTLAVLNGFDDNYLTDAFKPIVNKILEISPSFKEYNGNERIRIIADHVKAAVFIIGDGIIPSNTGQGYVLRRLIRRSIRWGTRFSLKSFIPQIAESVFHIYEKDYHELRENKEKIMNVLLEEEKKFNATMEKGLLIFSKKQVELIKEDKKSGKIKERTDFGTLTLSGKEAFDLFQSHGFGPELIEEECKNRGMKFDKSGFEKELKKHQDLSRTSSAGMFKSGLADHSVQTTKLHTATHLLNEALRHVLGNEVKQKGSNITPERLRFDFNFPRKLTEEEIKKVENLVNEKIKAHLDVVREEVSFEKAVKDGAQSEFGHKYPEKVSTYTILDKKEKKGWFSKEICTGPHVSNTSELGTFKIIKEESVSAGTRRIKAIVQ